MTKSVKGIGAEDFINWKHNPVSKIVLQYFRDYADALGKEALARFIGGGSLAEATQQEIRGRLLAATDASELSFESLRQFYQEEEEEDEHAETGLSGQRRFP